MKKTMKYWVEFWTPGIIVGESWVKEYDHLPDPKEVEWPENAYSFTIHQREDIVNDEKRYKGDPTQIGPMYYHPNSKIETLKEIQHR